MELLFRDEFMLLTSLSGASMVYWCKDPQSPPKILSTQCPSEKKVDSEARGVVLAATFSQSKYLALCTDFKQLLLYKTSKNGVGDWELLSSRDSPKKGTKLMFLPDESSVLMADKFGDLLRFSCDRPNEEYEVVLGHLSMLMDLAIVDRGSAICTADRDEKIRISCYPNSYNIKMYCLGHTSFVTCLVMCGERLVSSSGDGTIKLWNVLSGECLCTVLCESGQFVHKIVFDSATSTLACLLSSSPAIMVMSVREDSLVDVRMKELSGPGLGLCLFKSGLLVFQDCKSQPLLLLPINTEQISEEDDLRRSLNHISTDVTNRWSDFEHAHRLLTEFYSGLVKVNIENVEERKSNKEKRKHSKPESSDEIDNHLKSVKADGN